MNKALEMLRERISNVANNIGESLNAGCDDAAVAIISSYVDELFSVEAAIAELEAYQQVSSSGQALLSLANRLEGLLIAWDDTEIREERNRLAEDLRKLALSATPARPDDWPPCPECGAGVLFECPACSAKNYPDVPACKACGGTGDMEAQMRINDVENDTTTVACDACRGTGIEPTPTAEGEG